MARYIRHDWTLEEVREIYNQPLLDLVYQASDIHRHFHQTDDIQKCTLVSIKTGGCPEDCGYCSQSVHDEADLTREPLIGVEVIKQKAKQARAAGATRLCMGAAWRSAKKGKSFVVTETKMGGSNVTVKTNLGVYKDERETFGLLK